MEFYAATLDSNVSVYPGRGIFEGWKKERGEKNILRTWNRKKQVDIQSGTGSLF